MCVKRAYALCVPASFPLIYCAAVNKWAAGHFANGPVQAVGYQACWIPWNKGVSQPHRNPFGDDNEATFLQVL